MPEKTIIMDTREIDRALSRIAHEIVERNHGTNNLALVGIRTRGVPLAEVLQEAKSPDAKATVLMQFMGRLIQAQVSWEDLRPVDDDPPQMPALPRRTRGGKRWIDGFGPRTSITA